MLFSRTILLSLTTAALALALPKPTDTSGLASDGFDNTVGMQEYTVEDSGYDVDVLLKRESFLDKLWKYLTE